MKAIFYLSAAVLATSLLLLVLAVVVVTAHAEEWYYDPMTDGWYLEDLVYDPEGDPVHEPLGSIFVNGFESGAVHKWDAAIEPEELELDEELFR